MPFVDVGFELVSQAVTAEWRARLLALLYPQLGDPLAVQSEQGPSYGVRGLLWTLPTLAATLHASGLNAIASRLLKADAFAVDALLFDKHAGANWAVPSHQDRVMPVAEAGQGRSRTRGAIAYAQPSVATLQSLLALRLHFDATDEHTGALQLLAGSHERGIWKEAELRALSTEQFELARAQAGDVLALRPLLVHRSFSGSAPARRRVLHVVYASAQPECNLRWRAVA